MDTAWETNFTVILFKEILCNLKKEYTHIIKKY